MSQPNHASANHVSVDQLASHLATTSITHDSDGQLAYFPPGTSLDEQLLILAGVEDYKLTGTEGESFNAKETGFGNSRNIGGAFDAKAAMEEHLALLTSTELSSMMNNSLNITNEPTQPESYVQFSIPPVSPPFTGFQPSYPPGSLQHLISLYTAALPSCTSPDDLTNAPLPCCNSELESLSQYIVQVIGRMVEEGGIVVKSPKAHPFYPEWVKL